MTAPTAPAATATPGTPGASRLSKRYYVAGRMHVAAKPVPIDQYGSLAGTEYGCRRCRTQKWFPLTVKDAPVCGGCSRRMVAVPLKKAPMLPWKAIWDATHARLYPVFAYAGMATAGAAVDGAGIPGLALFGLAPAAGVVGNRVARRRLLKAAEVAGDVDSSAPGSDRRVRAAIDRQARAVGYTAAAGTGWLGLAAELGVDPHTPAGMTALVLLAAAGAVPTATWWRRLREAAKRREQVADEPVVVAQTDRGEAEVRRIWQTVIAVQPGGKLPGTILEDWYRLPGGWGATIVGPIGAYESDHYTAAIGKIASAFSVRKSMVTVMPDPEDENRAMVMVQRSSPLKGVQRWAGPDSIDARAGLAQIANYADTSPVLYELFREEWGCPHDFLCSTTGGGKSEALSLLLLIDRWAHYVDADGAAHGMVADLLIDPQQGQSYEPFMDDLAAPVAVDLAEAKLMVQAVRREMFRRNAYLSKRGWRDADGVLHRAEWTDKRGRTRYGRKWWNPFVDGPILTLNIDEAHEFLADREFATLVTAGARMYRKCGIRIRIATHTPLLTDLGGSMALRSMLTGGFVWAGRTADRLSGPTAFNGRLTADPCSLPLDPGVCFAMGGRATKPMMARTMWEPDFYDWVRNEHGDPIGFPAELPAATWEAFGPEFAKWVECRANDADWSPDASTATVEDQRAAMVSVEAVQLALSQAPADVPITMDQLDGELRRHGIEFSTRTIRDALKKLRDRGLVVTVDGRHALTAEAREQVKVDA